MKKVKPDANQIAADVKDAAGALHRRHLGCRTASWSQCVGKRPTGGYLGKCCEVNNRGKLGPAISGCRRLGSIGPAGSAHSLDNWGHVTGRQRDWDWHCQSSGNVRRHRPRRTSGIIGRRSAVHQTLAGRGQRCTGRNSHENGAAAKKLANVGKAGSVKGMPSEGGGRRNGAGGPPIPSEHT